MEKAVDAYFKKNRDRHIHQLIDFLRIPSVSTQALHKADVVRASQWVAKALSDVGANKVRIHKTPGHPIVTGSVKAGKHKPTVLVYGHYDVQPAEPLEKWTSPPFAPRIDKNKLYARGAADDKGQLFLYLKVIEALRAVYGDTRVNVNFLIEGEEEIGSPNLFPFIKNKKNVLQADAVLISDTHMRGPRSPSITIGLRGMVAFGITVRTARSDLHSGTYGGGVANAVEVLSNLLCQCKDLQTGRILIPGIYKNTRSPKKSSVSRELEKTFLHNSGAYACHGESGYASEQRTGERPTFEVNGLWGGYTGDGMKTVLPAEASAKISLRLVPQQDPQQIGRQVAQFLKSKAPPYAKVQIRRLENDAHPLRADRQSTDMKVAIQAVRDVFGTSPALTCEGGSIPIAAEFARVLKKTPVLLGFGLPDDNLHAPNEKFDLRMFDKGLRTIARFFDLYGET